MKRFAVMGNPIAHSLSPLIHNYFAQQCHIEIDYERILLEESTFSAQVNNFFKQGGSGLNITSPGKVCAFQLSGATTERCAKAGAANTLWMENGKLWADNTDGVGLVNDLQRRVNLQELRILILGAGGATRGILSPLWRQNPHSITIANRTFSSAQTLLKNFPFISITDLHSIPGVYDLIINTIAADYQVADLIPVTLFRHQPVCYDLIYNLEKPTSFMQLFSQHGCTGNDGLGMLVEQAAVSFKIWHNLHPETLSVIAQLRDLRKKSSDC
jgi:shikimate dehydrogenase